MPEITTADIKALREETGLSIAEVRKALDVAGGDKAKAMEVLKKRGSEEALKKSDRALGAGRVASYIHGDGTSGAIILLSSETDFVAKNEEFKNLAREIAMQVTAMKPQDKDELLAQPYIKSPDKTIGDLVNEAIQKFGERIEISHFSRLSQ